MRYLVLIIVDSGKCIKCNLCNKVCVSNLIDLEKNQVDSEDCSRCFHCLAVCPQEAITFQGELPGSLEEPFIDDGDFERFIQQRRSCRNYLGKDIPEELLKKIAGITRYSPTGTNTQKVHVTILKSREKVEQFANTMMTFYHKFFKVAINKFTYPFFRIIVGKDKAIRAFKTKRFFKRFFDGDDVLTYNAPSLFIFHIDTRDSSTPSDDCIIASTISNLYAESLGLASCFNGFIVYGLNLYKKLKKDLNIPLHHKVYSTFLLGYPNVKFKRKVFREETRINIV